MANASTSCSFGPNTSQIASTGITVASSTSSKWLLSPTLEVSSEEKTSLINSLKTDSEGRHEDPDNIMATSSAVCSKNFVKLPIDDRNKYEKLRSNDMVTSDDSDSEFFHEECIVTGTTSKKAIFKQIVTNNIPDTIHKISYHKVDRSIVKVPIVKKIKEKTTTKKPSTAAQQAAQQVNAVLVKHEKQQKQVEAMVAAATAENIENDDTDSIGSASDLRAEDDDFFDETRVSHISKNNPKIKRADLDGISESVNTCNSSAYHAECESVTTHEDDISRVVVKVRMRKKDRIAYSTSSDVDVTLESAPGHGVTTVSRISCKENEQSPTSCEFLNKFGDKPLLLDDELDYGSEESDSVSKCKQKSNADNQSNKFTEENKVKIRCTDHDEFDVFAMAPFNKPESACHKRKNEGKKYNKQKYVEFVKPSYGISGKEIWTSTPIKNVEHLVGINSPNENIKQEQPDLPKCSNLYDFNETIFNPFIPLQSDNNIKSMASKEISESMHCSNTSIISKLPSDVTPTFETCDLFDSEPFPQLITKNCLAKEGNNTVEPQSSFYSTFQPSTKPPQEPRQLVTVNHSIIVNKTPEPKSNPKDSVNIIHIGPYVDTTPFPPKAFTNIDLPSCKTQANIIPCAIYSHSLTVSDKSLTERSQECISAFDPDDEDKPTIFSGKDIELNANNSCESTLTVSTVVRHKEKKPSVVALTMPSKISQKVKGNSYKKVSEDFFSSNLTASDIGSTSSLTYISSKSKYQRSKYKTHTDEYEDESYKGASSLPKTHKNSNPSSFQSNSIQNSAKTGFSNMSFEDFPSDQEIGSIPQKKALPFEVLRSDKTLLEAEKKFGSLKRRSNLFS